MPTAPRIPTETLDPKTAINKFASLITDSSDTDEASDTGAEVEQDATEPSEPPPQSSDTESPEPETAGPETYDIDGENVGIEDLKRGYLRERDYTKKTMALADERRKFESERDETLGARN